MDRKPDNFLRRPQKDELPAEQAGAEQQQPPRRGPSAAALARRERRAAESILDNERLTEALDDKAAKALTDWGLAAAKKLAHATLNLSDQQAENALDDGMQATRRLMRYVNKLAAGAGQIEAAERDNLLAKISEQAGLIYGRPAKPLAAEALAGVLQLAAPQLILTGAPAEIVTQLRRHFEPFEPGGAVGDQPSTPKPYQSDLDLRSGDLDGQDSQSAAVTGRKARLPGQSKVDRLE